MLRSQTKTRKAINHIFTYTKSPWEGDAWINDFEFIFNSGLSSFYFTIFYLAKLWLNSWTLWFPIKLKWICFKGNLLFGTNTKALYTVNFDREFKERWSSWKQAVCKGQDRGLDDRTHPQLHFVVLIDTKPSWAVLLPNSESNNRSCFRFQ